MAVKYNKFMPYFLKFCSVTVSVLGYGGRISNHLASAGCGMHCRTESSPGQPAEDPLNLLLQGNLSLGSICLTAF